MVALYKPSTGTGYLQRQKKIHLKNVASSPSIRQADSVRSSQMLGAGPQEADKDEICLGHLEGPAMESESRSMLDKGSKPNQQRPSLNLFSGTQE